VIPVIPSCNTHAPVTMIGERAADFILHSAKRLGEVRAERQGLT
jgi:choline dehydrogenase-like flavoprotein